jgi:hypothetical protein
MIFPFGEYGSKTISRLARPYLYRAMSYAENHKYDKACIKLKQACELGECEWYDIKKRDGVCL